MVSAFDVIGPSMIGPSSSHTAGAVRIGLVARSVGLGRDRFVALVAGGLAEAAFSVEMDGEEDISAVPDLLLLQVGARDMVVGISASGTAFYVRSALAFARAATVLVHESDNPSAETIADFTFRLRSGAELIRGSTRMKAGTATKKALNILSTAAMILLGKVRHGEMVDLQCGNEKLRRRAERIVAAEAGISLESAAALLANSDYDLGRTREALKLEPAEEGDFPNHQ